MFKKFKSFKKFKKLKKFKKKMLILAKKIKKGILVDANASQTIEKVDASGC